MDFPMPHPGQPQSGINPHLAPPGHQHGPPLHPPLNPLPAPQFQDIPAPPFLPQALHQQYLLQQQILEAQHRHILPPSRYPYRLTVQDRWMTKDFSGSNYRSLVVIPDLQHMTYKLFISRMFSNTYLFVLVDAPRREFLTSLTGCGPATSLLPPFMSLLRLWCSSLATWLRAQTGKQNIKFLFIRLKGMLSWCKFRGIYSESWLIESHKVL